MTIKPLEFDDWLEKERRHYIVMWLNYTSWSGDCLTFYEFLLKMGEIRKRIKNGTHNR